MVNYWRRVTAADDCSGQTAERVIIAGVYYYIVLYAYIINAQIVAKTMGTK